MFFALISIFILIGVIYTRDARAKAPAGRTFWQHYRSIILLAVLGVLPFIAMNLFFSEGRRLTLLEKIDKELEEGTRAEIIEAYEHALERYPDSIPLYFGYVDARQLYNNQTCAIIDWSEFTNDQEKIGICHEYHMVVCHGAEEEIYELGEHNFNLNKTPFTNYVRGMHARQIGAAEKALQFFQREIRLNPNFDATYVELYRLIEHYFPEHYHSFLLNEEMRQHLPSALLQFGYFKEGYYGHYLKEIFKNHYLDIHPMAFLAALIISIIWLIYLRSLDIFRKERWLDIITVFLGGIFFTLFCIPIYHYAHFELGMGINGEPLNDFMYSTLVIGGAEETVKMLPWVIFALATRKLKEPYDYLLYASVAALGFAFAENWMYLENPNNIVGRSIMSTVAHMFDASILAYSLVLSRYKFKKIAWKIAAPIIGFALACVAHGFYDFWLISPSTRGLHFITTLFFILSIHVWFHLKNNAINHSQYYQTRPFNVQSPLNIFMFGMIGVLMLEYVLSSYEFGASWANYNLRSDALLIGAFLLYMTFNLKHIQPMKGVWKKYKLPKFKGFGSTLFSLPESSSTASEEDHTGLELRLFTPKSNQFIGHLLPISGVCQRRITVSGYDDWYVFHLKTSLGYANFRQDVVIVRPKTTGTSLQEDKIEIHLLLVPLSLVILDDIEVRQLRYTGRVYSRPI